MRLLLVALCVASWFCGGCSAPLSREECNALRDRAMMALKQGTGYDALPSVRAQAVESLQKVAPHTGLPWIRIALNDEHSGVRFAACVAIGTLRDTVSQPMIERCLSDPDASVVCDSVYSRSYHSSYGTRESAKAGSGVAWEMVSGES